MFSICLMILLCCFLGLLIFSFLCFIGSEFKHPLFCKLDSHCTPQTKYFTDNSCWGYCETCGKKVYSEELNGSFTGPWHDYKNFK